MTLTSKNYVFEGESEGTTEVSDVFATDDANWFTITKAAAPTDIQTGTLNVINGTQQTYTYDFSKLLPELSEGEYGTISYGNQADISLVSQSGYYYDESIVEFKNGVLTLAQFYAKDGIMTGEIGTVKVKVTTTNYEDFQLTLVLNAVNQIDPEPNGRITATPITYGNELSTSAITGTMQDPATGDAVNGTFTWDTPAMKLNAGSHDAKWTFTPDESYGGKYTTNTGTATVTVAKRGATVTPDNKSKVYQEKDPELTYIVSGVLSGETLKGITLARAEGENAGQYAITATADAGANPNYEVTFAKGTLTIEPKSITANGAEQTQTVEKVLLDDKEIPADSYTVAGNTATAPGRYTLTVTAKGNYTDSVEQIYAIAYKDTAVPSSSKPSSNNSSNDSETKKNEVAAPTPTPIPASTSKPSTITAMPQTGDTSNPTLYVVLLVASLLGLAVVFVCKKRNDK